MDDLDFTIAQVCQELGVSRDKIRRFCNSGLVPGYKYTIRRHRSFTADQVDWLRILVFLSRAGFSTKDLRKYVRLAQAEGSAAKAERMNMLRTHKRQVWQELEVLQATIDFLERQEELIEGEGLAGRVGSLEGPEKVAGDSDNA